MSIDSIPERHFWCDHSDVDMIIEVRIPEDSGWDNHYKCKICNSTFPVIGDTDKWYPVLVEYEMPFGEQGA